MVVEEIINLLDDPGFKLWVLSPGETDDQFWTQVIQNHPERKEAIFKARIILEALDKEFEVDFPEQESVNSMLRTILSQKKR